MSQVGERAGEGSLSGHQWDLSFDQCIAFISGVLMYRYMY